MRLKDVFLLGFIVFGLGFAGLKFQGLVEGLAEAEDSVCPPCPVCFPSPSPSSLPTPVPTASPTPTPIATPVPTAQPSPSPLPQSAQGQDDSCLGLNLKTWAQDADGWTLFPVAAKTIFVSASGLVPLGAPASSVAARTLLDGFNLLEKGKHQALLFQRGETFVGSSLDSKLGGLDPDHLMVIGAYGSGARPKLVFKGSLGLVAANGGSNVAFVDLDLDGFQSTADGIRFVQSSGSNILIEGVRIAGFTNGIAADFQSPDATPAFKNLVIRRSVIIDNFAKDSASHSQGVYLSKAAGVRFEENVFDHNGWKNLGNGETDRAQKGSGSPTMFNHNGYIQSENSCISLKNNVVLRGAATGWQMRAGGVIEGNFFALNPIQLTYGSVNGGSVQAAHILPGLSGHVSNNVFVWGTDISPALLRDGDLELGNVKHAVFENNLVAHHVRGPAAALGVNLRGAQNGIGIHNLLVQNNVIYDVATLLQFQGSAWGPVNLKAEKLTGPDQTGTTVTRMLASVYLPNGTLAMNGLASGIAGHYAPLSIADSGTILSNNVLQTGPTDFWNPATAPKSSVQIKTMQKAPVLFKDPNRKIDEAYLQKVRNSDRSHWDLSVLAPAMNAWMNEGFQKK